MDTSELQPLFDNYHRKISKIDLRFKRYLYYQINWDSRFIGIKGPRGVGKTTMLLQHILKNYADIDQTLYASLDDLWFASHSLMDLVDWAWQHGVMRLYLDEVHRYDQWAATLKNIYDSYPDMSIVYTSSSLLIMDNAKVDLSRRQTVYTLYGMSFREYLMLEGVISLDAIPLEELLQEHVRHAMRITKAIKVAPLFDPNIDNNPGALFKEDGLVEILTDYNATYGTTFTIPTFAAYKKDLSLRLAHKSPYTGIVKDRAKQIDLLIVVDQMLTGFDSKWVNTLYLDKVLRYEGLIQAFSRTNRLFDPAEKQ